MNHKHLRQLTGLLFITGAIFVNIPYTLLIMNFNYPDILREPAGVVLTQFQAGGAGLIFTWLAFAWAGLPLFLGMILYPRASGGSRSTLIKAATITGIIAFLVQVIGLLRWVFVVPVLAQMYVDPATSASARETAVIVFQTIHQFGGVVLGEHMGQLFSIAWTVLLCLAAWRHGYFPRWLAGYGIASGLVYLLAQTELLATVIPGFPVVGEAGLIGSLLWLLWIVGLGVMLLRPSTTAVTHPSITFS